MSVCDDSATLESCSKCCDIISFRVQEHWQLSAACIVPLNVVPCGFWMLCCRKKGEKLTNTGVIAGMPSLPVVTILDNDGTSRFQVLVEFLLV